MALVLDIPNDFLRPIMRPDQAVLVPIKLPTGGPVGVGGPFAKGTVIAYLTSTTPASEVRTLTISGSPTGFNGTFTYVSGSTTLTAALPNAAAAIPTAVQVQSTLEQIFGVGNVSVTKSSLVYTFTFQNELAYQMIGGALSFSGTFTAGSTPSAALATSTAGHAGPGQAAAYNDSNSDGTQVARGVLKYDYISDPQGGRATDIGNEGQPFSPVMYVSGYFRCGDLTGLDANGLADLGRLVEGTSVSNADAVIKIN